MELDRLKKIVAEVLCVDTREITEETTFVDDLCADSLDIFQIVMGIEEEFGIEISPEDVEKISTVKEAVALIQNCGKGREKSERVFVPGESPDAGGKADQAAFLYGL